MNHKISIVICFFLALLNGGCAWTTAVAVDPNNPQSDGFVYYACKPLVVLSGGQISITYVKNPNRAYAVRFGAFLAKNHAQVTFNQDCGITEVDTNMDSTSIIPLLQELAKAALTTTPVAGAPNGTVVQVYDVVFDDVGEVIELRPLIKSKQLVHVPVPAEQ